MMSWWGQYQQHDQNRLSSSGSSVAVITAPKRSLRKTGCFILVATLLLLAVRPGDALVNPTGQINTGSSMTPTVRAKKASLVVKTAARIRTRSSHDSIRRQAFWDDRGDSGARRKGGAKEKTGGNSYVSPLPEGFPPASTLLRPEGVDYSMGNFLDTSIERFENNDSSLWQSLRFRLKPLGRISSRTRILKITLGDKAALNLVPKPSFIGMSELDLYGCTTAFKTAAHDPRIKGVLLDLASIEMSTATLMEVRRAMDYFTQSGKPLWGFSESSLDMTGLNLMGGCTRRIATPEAYVNIIGFSFGTEFYRGFFDKVGIEPQVRRIGEFKTFGDTYARDSMSAAQREVTESLLSAVSDFKVGLLSRDAGSKSVPEVESLYNSDNPITVYTLKEFGLLDGIYYQDQMLDLLSREIDKRYATNFLGLDKLGGDTKKKKKKKQLVDISKTIIPATTYLRRTRRNPVEGVPGIEGDKTIAVLNAEGAIIRSGTASSQGNLLVEEFRQQVKAVLQDASIEGVVVRISSPGGDALASDLMWREVRRLREGGKSVVASICNVAASGGYYIAMGCEKIVCDELSITGSIGVVQAKFAIGELIDKVGIKIERISKGKYAELFAPERGFTREEDVYWSTNAMRSYNDFVAKAAMSRRMPLEDMKRRAQGRVWTGAQAKVLGLVDELGGLDRAIEVCRDMMDLRSIAATKLKEARRKEKKEEEEKEKKEGKENTETQAIDAKVTETDDGGGDSAVEAPGEEGKTSPDGEDEEVLADAKIPFGPLGSILPEDYSDLERQVVEEAKEELRRRKEEAQKAGTKRLTRVKNIVPGPTGFLSTLGNVLQVEDGDEEWLTHVGLAPTRPSKPAPINLIEGLSVFTGPEASRPLAVLDDSIARMLPGISGVPEELRRLGVGPLLHTFLAKSPGLAEALIEMLGKLGLSSLLD